MKRVILCVLLVSLFVSLGFAQPATPTNLSATVQYQRVILKWNKIAGTTFKRYRIYRGTTNPASTKIDSTSTSLTDTVKVETAGTIVGNTAYFRVTAVDTGGVESAFSNQVTAVTSYPLVSIYSTQFISSDSLRASDAVLSASGPTSTATGAWTKQTSINFYTHTQGGSSTMRDTVEIVGQIIVPPKIVTFTGTGAYNFTLRDTAANATGAWSQIFVRTGAGSNAADSTALYNAGLLTYVPGDIIRLRGYVDEFPTNNFASYTEFVPIVNTTAFLPTVSMPQCVVYVGTKSVPKPISVTVDQFMTGGYSGDGKNIKCSTGEQWEDCYVQLTNLKVLGDVNTTNGTVTMQDASGNEIATMDGSKWFTLRTGSASSSGILYRDPSSTFTKPKVGQVIDTIRGYIATNSGSDAARGYRIYPVFPGDIVLGKLLPIVSTHRRNPVALTSTDSAKITFKSYTSGAAISTVVLKYSISNGAWQSATMTGPNPADSTWAAAIRPVGADTTVRYYCIATDVNSNTSLMANAGFGSTYADTNQGFFFYTVRNRALTISDVQYTPYSNGLSPLLGALVTISGVVTADTSDLNINSTGTGPWYIQNGNAPWNGIWVYDAKSILTSVQKGDSITVLGTVQENNDGLSGQVGRATRISDSTVTVVSHGKALPSPVICTTLGLSAGNGASTAEPYEGMLVQVNNVTVTDTLPTFSDNTEYAVSDGSGATIVRDADGKNKYSVVQGDTLYGKTILKNGARFSYIKGILYYSFNQYKLVPRTNSDYGVYTPPTSVKRDNTVPTEFKLAQNYPNPFNPSTKIEFDLNKSGFVSLKIYNILGQEIASLVDDTRAAGHYMVQFDASRYPSGMYIYRLQSASGAAVKKMLLIK